MRFRVPVRRLASALVTDSIFYEQKALTPELRNEISQMGYYFWDDGAETRVIGIAEGIMIDQKSKIIYGASDRRGGGLAVGY